MIATAARFQRRGGGGSLGQLDRASWISKLQAGAQIATFELTLPRLFPLFYGHKVGMLFLGLATSRQVLELRPVLVQPLPSFEEFPTSAGLNHPVPLSFHLRAGQLDHSWVSRFYNTQLAPGKLTIVIESWGRSTGGFLVLDQKTTSWTHV